VPSLAKGPGIVLHGKATTLVVSPLEAETGQPPESTVELERLTLDERLPFVD